MLQVFSLRWYHSSYIEDEVRRTVPSWIPPNVTMLYESQWTKFFWQKFTTRNKYSKLSWPIWSLGCWKLCSLKLSLMLETGWQVSLPLKVFRTESRGKILVRGEGCNTPGVSHKLSSEFGLKLCQVVIMSFGSWSQKWWWKCWRSNLWNWVPT